MMSNDVADIFKWYGVNHLCGVTYAEAQFMDKYQEGFCSMVSNHPELNHSDKDRIPFMFLNMNQLNGIPIHESVQKIMGASFSMALLTSKETDSIQEVYKKSEKIASDVMELLKFPKVFHII